MVEEQQLKVEPAAQVEQQKVMVESREDENTEERASKKMKTEQVELDAELKEKIVKQIDYYFSDVNLIKDKFMQEQLKKNDSCIKLSVLSTFSRLAQLTKDEDLLIAALKDFKSSNLELEADKKQIRRTKPIPNGEEFQKQLDLRTVHISGFPDTMRFEDLLRFCSNHGEVESLSMRRHFKTKQFKGCIHVVYREEATATKVLSEEKLVFKDRELRRESMKDYYERKDAIKKNRMEKRKNKTVKGDDKDD